MENIVLEKYNKWINYLKTNNEAEYHKLKSITSQDYLYDLFYKDLEFGTGGLRGIMELGSNRFNEYNVYKATRGYGNYLLSKFERPSVVIGFDSRNNSQNYAKIAANVLLNLGIKVYLFSKLIPTPIVSYAIRLLKANGGIIITASHNPKEYNGYKVYNYNGGQITLSEANLILEEINKIDALEEYIKFSECTNNESLVEIYDAVLNSFISSTLKTSVLKDFSNKNIKIVYTPLNGTGLVPVLNTLKNAGFHEIVVPKKQEQPDGNFPTCPYPNPELKEALKLGVEECNETNSDLLLATDPDCDRCGVGVRYKDRFVLLNGNEIATLLLQFLIETKKCDGKEIVRSIVSTSIVDKIASENNINVKKVLTGFKFIGEEINNLELNGKLNDFLFGFEESYGYLTNTEVRDKDAINACLLISEMFYFYYKQNINLIEKLNSIYRRYGYCKNKLITHTFNGPSGIIKMNMIISNIRKASFERLNKLFGLEVVEVEDFLNSKSISKECNKIIDLPKSNVIIVRFKHDVSIILRASGTEPKLKCYLEAINTNSQDACDIIEHLERVFLTLIKS